MRGSFVFLNILLLASSAAFADVEPKTPNLAVKGDSAPVFRCPGTDPSFFMEIEESGWVGYGETWDMHNCGEGREVYVPGANRRWVAMRPKILELFKKDMNIDVVFYSTVLPWGLFGTFFGIFGGAWLLALRHRRKKVVVLNVDCSNCENVFPVVVDAGENLFCPSCGGACAIVEQSEDGEYSAYARTL